MKSVSWPAVVALAVLVIGGVSAAVLVPASTWPLIPIEVIAASAVSIAAGVAGLFMTPPQAGK